MSQEKENRMSPSSRRLTLPLSDDVIKQLHAGQAVSLTGTVYTARDAAHQRLVDALDNGDELPIDLEGATIYYCGPTPARPDRPIGAAGPTTSARMDSFTPRLYQAGVKATIGKGPRSRQVREACRQHVAVYLVATGGAGALLATHVREAQVVAYDDLGPEAIHRLEVEDFPAMVGYDIYGATIFCNEEDLA